MAVDSSDIPLLNVYRVDSLPSYGSDNSPPAYTGPVTHQEGLAAYVAFPYSPPPSPLPETREYHTETIYACQHAVFEMEMLPVSEDDVELRAVVSSWLFDGDLGNPHRVFQDTPCDICLEAERERRGSQSEIRTAACLVFAILLWFVSAVIIVRLLLGLFMFV